MSDSKVNDNDVGALEQIQAQLSSMAARVDLAERKIEELLLFLDDKYLDAKESINSLDMGRNSFYAACNSGDIKHVLRGKKIYVSLKEIHRYRILLDSGGVKNGRRRRKVEEIE